MGYYIETGEKKGKAKYLRDECEGVPVEIEIARASIGVPDIAVIVIIDNDNWEGAAFAVDMDEFNWLTLPVDTRPRQFILMDRKKACELTGYVDGDKVFR